MKSETLEANNKPKHIYPIPPLWFLSIKRNSTVVQEEDLETCWGKGMKKNPEGSLYIDNSGL